MNNQKADDYILNGNFALFEGNLKKARSLYRKALKEDPQSEIALCNLANVYLKANDLKNAIKFYKKSLKIKPNYVLAMCNMGIAYSRRGDLKRALSCYQEALEINENYTPAYVYLGNILLAQGDLDNAILCYRMAIKKDPKQTRAYNNLGTAYARQLDFKEALRAYKRSLEHNRADPDILSNIANTYAKLDKPVKSVEYFEKAYQFNPENSLVIANLFHQLKKVCDWKRGKEILPKLNKITQKELSLGIKTGEDPFINVIRDENIKRNFAIASIWSRNIENSITGRKPFSFPKTTKSDQKRRIRIGYFSAHLYDHPTGYLTKSLFKLHDREKFEIFIYSFGPDDKSKYRNTIKKTSDAFIDLFGVDYSESAKQIHKDKIDILVDLDGYTDNNRLEVLALRPAPIQVTYLGFPGTTGAKFIDYVITDKTISPKKDEKYYSEKLVYLPHSYQINDDQQNAIKTRYKKSQFNLPRNSFIFCCFNGSYKIEPSMFDIWMNTLKSVPKSVLWLLKTNKETEKNLKEEAKKIGINRYLGKPFNESELLENIRALLAETMTNQSH